MLLSRVNIDSSSPADHKALEGMTAPNVPKIRVCDPAAAEADVEEKWIDLVGSNLGPEIQELYRDNTNLRYVHAW